MGLAYYKLTDGRDAGYAVDAPCDEPGCPEIINRGMGYLCGDYPETKLKAHNEGGCGDYFCDPHLMMHDCRNPMCGYFDDADLGMCILGAGHEGSHRDDQGQTFS